MKVLTASIEAILILFLFALFITPFVVLSGLNISSTNTTVSQKIK